MFNGKKIIFHAVDFAVLLDVATPSDFWTLNSLLFRQRWACKVLPISSCTVMARCRNAWRIQRLCWDQPAKLMVVVSVSSSKPLAIACSLTSCSLRVAHVPIAWPTGKTAASCLGLLGEEPCKQLSLLVLHQFDCQRQVRQIYFKSPPPFRPMCYSSPVIVSKELAWMFLVLASKKPKPNTSKPTNW